MVSESLSSKLDRKLGANLLATLQTLFHISDKGVPKLMEETYCIHEVCLASLIAILVLAQVFCNKLRLHSQIVISSCLNTAFLALTT